jgi:hypothetical protein
MRAALITFLAAMALSPAAAVAAPGDLDTTFNPNADSSVYSVGVQGDGKILIGGDFTTVGGQARNRVARLNADGTLDTTFANPNANDIVLSVGVQGDGKILIGGDFTTVGGQARQRVARLSGPSPPAAPTGVSAAAGQEQATVSWTAVTGQISGYTATASPGGQSCTTTTTSRTVTGLTAGTTYTFTVTAANEFGSGPASSPSNSVTPAGPTPTPTPTVSVSALKGKVSKKGAYLTSRVTVSGAGRIAQAATTSRRVGKGSKRRTKVTTRCRVSKTVAAAGTYTLKCNLGSKGRKALRKEALRLTVKTTLTPTAGAAVSKQRKLTLKRKR